MRIGVPQEIKNHEYRVGLTPTSVRELSGRGHALMVQSGAGAAIGLSDEQYRQAGAVLVPSAEEVFGWAEMVVKVKEPQSDECRLLREGQILYTFLHLAPDRDQTAALLKSGAVCVAYETITGPDGGLPLLAPMSEVAGRMAIQAGAAHLEISKGGMGLLLGGVPGVALADLVIGGVLVPGAAAPKLVTRHMVSGMKPGAVVVDVAIDQGGCFETSHPTTHAEPTFVVDGVVHYCVANMPGAVARTSTFALNNATLAHALAIADKGWRQAAVDDLHLRNGLNVVLGQVTHEAVARSLGYTFTPALQLLR